MLNHPGQKGIIANILLFVTAVIVMNGLVFGLGWDVTSDKAALQTPYIKPSGILVGTVWIVLIVLLSIARWHLNRYDKAVIGQSKKWVTMLILACILYPFYSIAINGLLGIYGGLLGNISIILLGTFIIKLTWVKARITALLILPVLIWVPFATTIIMSELGWL